MDDREDNYRREYKTERGGYRKSSHHDRKGGSKKSAEATFFSGLAFTVAFGVVWYMTKHTFWVFPLVFAGLLPMIRGLRYFVEKRTNAPSREIDVEARAEKEILKIAREKGGRITPTMVALESYLSIEMAEKVLEKIARRGYATMQVTEDGRIEYEFPEFLPENK